MRVRAFIHLKEDPGHSIDESAYYSVEEIAGHSGMRAVVITELAKRMANLASELKMWKLSDQEQAELFHRLREAMQ